MFRAETVPTDDVSRHSPRPRVHTARFFTRTPALCITVFITSNSPVTSASTITMSSPPTSPTTPAAEPTTNGAHAVLGPRPGEPGYVDTGPTPDTIEDDEDLLDDYPPDTEELDLIHLRITSLPRLRLDRFPKLRKLCVRQNRIQDIEALEPLADTLEELDLYDNAIAHIHGLEKLEKLETLDLSFNSIKHIKRIDACKNVKMLYFVQNRIGRIEGLEELKMIRMLELGANKIREIENIAHLTHLEELWLGKNKITELKVWELGARDGGMDADYWVVGVGDAGEFEDFVDSVEPVEEDRGVG